MTPKIKPNMLFEYLTHIFVLVIPCLIPITFDVLILKILLLYTHVKEIYRLWVIISVFFYFIPTILITIYFLCKWNKNPNLFLANLFSNGKQPINFDKEKFRIIIEITTISITFFLLISKPYSIKPFENPSDSLFFIIYPVNLGFKIWDYLFSQPKKVKQYFPHRKYK